MTNTATTEAFLRELAPDLTDTELSALVRLHKGAEQGGFLPDVAMPGGDCHEDIVSQYEGDTGTYVTSWETRRRLHAAADAWQWVVAVDDAARG